MYHTEPPADKTIREWYMNSSRVAACALRNEQAVRAHGPGRPHKLYSEVFIVALFVQSSEARSCLLALNFPESRSNAKRFADSDSVDSDSVAAVAAAVLFELCVTWVLRCGGASRCAKYR